METKLAFYFLDYESQKIFNYFCLGKGPLREINQNIIIIDVKCPKIIYDDHFIIDFKLLKNDKENRETAKSFNLDIYIKRLNQYYCFINCINNYSFDIIILRNDYENIEKTITIHADKNYIIDKSNMFGLKRCKKFGVINCDKSYLSDYNFDFPSHCFQGSYYLNVFYYSKGKPPKFSLQKITLREKKSIDFSLISNEKKNTLLKIPDDYINLYNKYDKNNVDIMQVKLNFSCQMIKMFKLYDFSELQNLRYLLARNINLNLSNEEFDICFGYVIYLIGREIAFLYNAIIFSNLIIDLLIELKANLGERNLNTLRILLWFNYNYLNDKEFINSFNSVEDYKVSKSILDFKLCYPKRCNKNTPYYNAYNFMKNFVDNLTEDSYLLEIFYLIDSEASSNRIYKNCRVFKFSLLSLEQIKSHLKYLIPEVVIRFKKSEKYSSNGSYIFNFGLSRIFENEIFDFGDNLDKYLIQEKDTDCRYTIPIIMVLIHECFCHGKIRLSREGSESPNYFYNPHDNYELSFHIENGESGRLFEFYISKNIDVIRFLKYSLEPLSNLLDINLWVGKNLNKLNQIILQRMENYDFDKIEKQKIYAFPTGQKEQNLQYAKEDKDYDSEVYPELYEDDQKLPKKKKIKIEEKFC